VITFDPGSLSNTVSPYGFIGVAQLGPLQACADPGGVAHGSNCFYSGNNSACAIQTYDSLGDLLGGRIYAVTNQIYLQNNEPSDYEQYQGRLYALDITTSGINQTWYYDFVTHGGISGVSPVVGPSGASPLCSAPGLIFTDYGSQLDSGRSCSMTHTDLCGAGVLGLYDCDLEFTRSPACGSLPYAVIYTFPIGSLPVDGGGDGDGDTGEGDTAGTFFNANFSYDPTNGCFWVRPYAAETQAAYRQLALL